ncbi:site-specific integrase [Candidatus Sneabacter namystus]|uniref:Uncharacterized protein n=1 Tax=Candidatus Sneabacter namystus TaxID=2601646 RepID=A0A5C0UGT8_9RICK|nr:hypothetical protein [Candidatus Sneabacter namystus]QEK39345.1 hypothetical protein FZC37_00070 [Candidatus Sneabacter namystus]
MRWSNSKKEFGVDLENSKWTYLPQKQIKKEVVHAPLSKRICAFLQTKTKESKQVLNFPYLRVYREWVKIRKQMPESLWQLNIHDLRRTRVHWGKTEDVLITQHTLGHKLKLGNMSTYTSNAATFEKRLQITQELEDKLYSLMNIKDE